ncbi:MAG: hypothetical protein ACLQEQ_04745 [Nitrososphaerales archaeon]
MDALLYGLLKSLDYLGEQRRVILDRMGSVMLQYLIETGTIPTRDRPGEFARSLRRLLIRNGYDPRIPLQSKAVPKTLSSPNLVEILMPMNRRLDGGAFPKSSFSVGKERVDWVLYEMVLYGMTRALDDQLGVQAQLILDRIGTGMLDYLLELGAIERSDDQKILLQNVIDYFVKAGYAKSFRFELEGAPPDTFVSRYESARYYTTVFRRIRKEGSALLSCPLCLVGHSIWATQGWKFGDNFEVRIQSGGKVLAKAKVYPSVERFTEKDALRFSQMKVKP